MKVFYSTNMCASHERSWVEIKNSIPNFKKVNNPKRADVILAYLCAMSTEELNESRSKLKEFSAIKTANPRIKLIAGGCAVEIMNLQNEFPAIDATFTKLSTTMDPETISGGHGGSMRGNAYPLTCTKSFGLSLTF